MLRLGDDQLVLRQALLCVASEHCCCCQGLGWYECAMRGRGCRVCKCALRGVFRACLNKYRRCEIGPEHSTRAVFIRGGGKRYLWSRPDEEFRADFVHIVERALTERQRSIFRFHLLLRCSQQICSRRLGVDKGEFWHEVYRIHVAGGAALLLARPYRLYPTGAYFAAAVGDPQQRDKGRRGLRRRPLAASGGVEEGARRVFTAAT